MEITRTIDTRTSPFKVVQEIRATKPGQFDKGDLISKDDAARTIELLISDKLTPETIVVFVPPDVPVLLNGARSFQGRPVTLASLVRGDHLKVQYERQAASGNKATKVEALRPVELKGVLAADYDARARLLSVIDDKQQVVKLPFGSDYRIFVNGKPVAEPLGLKRGDRVTIKHDAYITEVVAQRTLGAEGTIEQVRFEPPLSLSVAGEGGQKTTYSAGADCKVTLGGETVPFDVLRAGDRVTIQHGAIDPKDQKLIAATSIAAERPTDPARWALLIAVQNYDDTKMSKLDYPLADAAALSEMLSKRYRVPADQLRAFNDPSAVTLEREVPEFLKLVPAEGRLIIYFVGHACRDDKGQLYLAPKDFHSDKPEVNGRPLQWLVDLMERCPAKEKLFLLDGSHQGSGAEQPREPSSAEMIASLKRQPNRALLLTVTAVASCQQGQRELQTPDKQHGLFAACLAEGYGGAADAHHNTRVEPTELFAYLQKAMAADSQGKQTPQIFLPDDRPPRLTEAAKAAIRHMADLAARAKIDPDELEQDYASAAQLAASEPEPRLVYGLVLMKRKDGEGREKAIQHFQTLKSDMPDRLLPYAALAWLRLEKRSYAAAVSELAAMIAKVPKPQGGETSYSPETKYLFGWAGRLREFAAGVNEPSRPLGEASAALDAAVFAHGQQAVQFYDQGRQATKAVLADFDARIAASKDDVEIKRIEIDRRQLPHYGDFPLDKYMQQVRQQLDQ